MKNKKGFVFIETIVTVVVLSTALLYLYSSYSSIINREEDRLYYDDLAYVYKTNFVRNFLEDNTNIEDIKRYAFVDTYVVTIGPSYDDMFTLNQLAQGLDISLENIYINYNINQMIILNSQMIDDCYGTNDNTDICITSNENINYNLSSYIDSLSNTNYDYYLIVEYSEKIENGEITKCTPNVDTNCHSYYVSLEI